MDKILTTSSHSLSFPYLCSTQTLSQKITNFFLLFFSNAKEEERRGTIANFATLFTQVQSNNFIQKFGLTQMLSCKKQTKNNWVALSNENVSVTIFQISEFQKCCQNDNNKEVSFPKKTFYPEFIFFCKNVTENEERAKFHFTHTFASKSANHEMSSTLV